MRLKTPGFPEGLGVLKAGGFTTDWYKLLEMNSMNLFLLPFWWSGLEMTF